MEYERNWGWDNKTKSGEQEDQSHGLFQENTNVSLRILVVYLTSCHHYNLTDI